MLGHASSPPCIFRRTNSNASRKNKLGRVPIAIASPTITSPYSLSVRANVFILPPARPRSGSLVCPSSPKDARRSPRRAWILLEGAASGTALRVRDVALLNAPFRPPFLRIQQGNLFDLPELAVLVRLQQRGGQLCVLAVHLRLNDLDPRRKKGRMQRIERFLIERFGLIDDHEGQRMLLEAGQLAGDFRALGLVHVLPDNALHHPAAGHVEIQPRDLLPKRLREFALSESYERIEYSGHSLELGDVGLSFLLNAGHVVAQARQLLLLRHFFLLLADLRRQLAQGRLGDGIDVLQLLVTFPDRSQHELVFLLPELGDPVGDILPHSGFIGREIPLDLSGRRIALIDRTRPPFLQPVQLADHILLRIFGWKRR